MGEHQAGADLCGELAEVLVVPGGVDALEDRRLGALAVPADPEPVAVGGRGPHPRVETLLDERVLRLEEKVLGEDRVT